MVPDTSPLQELVELLGRRHALTLVVSLQGGPQPFGVLAAGAANAGAGTSQVTQRLRELREAGLVEVDEGGDYRLTRQGRRLQGALDALRAVAGEWAALTPRQRSPRRATARGRGEPGSAGTEAGAQAGV